MRLQTGNGGKIRLTDNLSTSGNGGAIYNNAAKLMFDNTTGALTGADYRFRDNKAVNGGAIYNGTKDGVGSTISGNLKNTTIIFSDNIASGGKGGAIYNDTGSTVELDMSGTSSITFQTVKDDIYNLGTVTIKGDSSNPTLPSPSGIVTFAGPGDSTSIVLNSTFGGTGTYNVSNTNLKLGTSGYIDYEPVINLSNNVISMDKQSYINLSTKDSIINNDFKISNNAVLTYNASDSASTVNDIALANTINNAGMINVADNVLTTVQINTLDSDNGIIKIDVHDAAASSQPLTADVITINNRIYGTTNVVFDNSDKVVMSLSDRIYFGKIFK